MLCLPLIYAQTLFGYVPCVSTYVRTSKGVCNSIYVCMVVRLGERGIDVRVPAPSANGLLWARASLLVRMLCSMRVMLVLWLRAWPA